MERARRATGTALLTGVVCGLFLMAVAIPFGPALLRLMNCDPDVLPIATLYLRILFVSMPLQMLYNFVSSAIRASGNSTYPMIIGLTAGGCKVGFNLLFVGLFKLGAPGAAMSTFCAQIIAFTLVLTFTIRNKDAYYTLEKKNLRINKEDLLDIVRIGLPAGIQGSLFSISNVIIQSTVNSFGSIVVAGNAAAANLEGFVYVCMNSLYQSAITFTSQNLGAGKVDRIRSGMRCGVTVAMITSAVIATVMLTFGRVIVGSFLSGSPEDVAKALDVGCVYLNFMSVCLPVLYILHVTRSAVQGMENTVLPMVSGVAEFVMRTGGVLLLPAFMGENGIFLAEVLAWMGADMILVPSYFIMLRKLSR
jgi:putative MATE family efflux protein